MIVVKQKGDFKHLEGFFKRMKTMRLRSKLEQCGREGVEALSKATPIDTGLTASSWNYEITMDNNSYGITWTNSNVANGWFNVALMLQLGHGTRNGGYVKGIDYINPALQPVFDKFAEDLWGEVTKT
mgnify:CR=1 FL=1